MGGVYGEIDSRADFQKMLDDARARSRAFLAKAPKDQTMEVLDTQLDAIQRWTANGRDPLPQERESISMSLIAGRELMPTDDPEVFRFVNELTWLHNYFEDWPTDDEAASATDEDFWEEDG